MKKLSVYLVCIFVIMSMVGCGENEGQQASGKPLVVAMELAYPPFETKDNAGTPTGISVDLAYAIGEYLEREVVIQNTAWDGLIPSLQTGKADLVISSMTITDGRKSVVDFSKPYANVVLGMLTNVSSHIERVEDLNQGERKVVVKTGSTGHIYASDYIEHAQLVALADESACVTEVDQGKADAFIYDQLTIYRNSKEHSATTKPVYIPFQDPEQWGIAVAKGNEELLNQINEFLVSYTEEGGFDALSEKYLSEEKLAFEELGFMWFFDLEP